MKHIDIQFLVSGTTIGGAERQLLYFLQNFDRSRFRCEVLTVLSPDSHKRLGSRDFRPELTALGIPFQSLDLPTFPSASGFFALWSKLKRSRAHILHCYGLAVDLASRCMPTHHQIRIGSMRGTEDHRSNLTFQIDGITARMRLNGYVSNSNAGKKSLVERAKVPETLITVIPNGIDAKKLQERSKTFNRNQIRKELGLVNNTCAILAVGNISVVKGYEYLVEAASTLKSRYGSTLQILIAGNDSNSSSLRQKIEQTGTSQFVKLLGHRDDIPKLLLAADLYISSSLQEGMSNAIMEAMGMGLPIIATDVGDSCHLLDNGQCGTIVARKSASEISLAIQRYLGDATLRNQHGKRALGRIVEKFSISDMVNKQSQLYTNLLTKLNHSSRQA